MLPSSNQTPSFVSTFHITAERPGIIIHGGSRFSCNNLQTSCVAMDMDLFQSVNSKQKDQDAAASPSSGDATSKASPRKQNILSSYSFLESDLLQTSSRLRERKAAKKNLQQQQHLSSLPQDDGSISIAAGPSDEGPTITTNTSVLLPPPPQPHARGNPATTAYATGACGDFNIEMPVRHGSSVSSMSSHPSGSATGGGGSSSGGGGRPSTDTTTQPNRFQSLFSSASCGDGDNGGDGCLEGAGDSCPSTFTLQ